MKYRKKPVVIEAYQFIKGFYEDKNIPQEFKDAACRKDDCNATFVRPHIHTLESQQSVFWITLDDFIIKGIKGEFYACKPDIFKATYELAGTKTKDDVFIKHIQKHLNLGERVICKICGRTATAIIKKGY